jgi:hypothetical protein
MLVAATWLGCGTGFTAGQPDAGAPADATTDGPLRESEPGEATTDANAGDAGPAPDGESDAVSDANEASSGCGAMTHAACLDCCLQQHTAGAYALLDSVWKGCACPANECKGGTACNMALCLDIPSSPPAACARCLDDIVTSGGCGAMVSACAGDPTCHAFLKCIQSCP